MKAHRWLGWVCVAVLLLVVSSVPAWGQATGLTGTVTDASGARVPKAEVSLTNRSTGAVRSTATSEDGVYVFTQLNPGRYKIEIKREGFKTAERADIEVVVGKTSTFDVQMEVGQVADRVVVTVEVAALNTTDASIGNVLTGRQIQNLPSLNLDPAGLLSLQPGVTFVPGQSDLAGGYSGSTNFDGRGGSVNGSRSDQSNITLDGADVNDSQNGFAFTSVLRSTQASLQEFRVTTSNANSEAGRSSAAQIQLVTKSGTNELHGDAYWGHRNEVFNANDFFSNRDGVERGKFRRHIYGLGLGGPIKKNRLFLFGNWEELRENITSNPVRDVPSLSFRDGVVIYECQNVVGFPACPTTATTVMGLSGTVYNVPADHYGLSPAEITALDPLGIGPNPAVAAHFALFPTPNAPGNFDRLNIVGFNFNAPTNNFFRTWILRADLNIDAASNHTLFWRGTMHDDNLTISPPQLPGEPPNQLGVANNKGFSLGYRAIFSRRLVNSFTYGMSRIGEQTAGRQTGEFVDFRFISNLQDFDSNSLGRILPVHHIRNDVSWTTGKHAWNFGGEMRFIRNKRFFNGNSFHTFLINPSWLPDGGRQVQPGRPECDPLVQPACMLVPAVSSGFASSFRDAMPAMLGSISQVDAFYNFDRSGNTLPAGTAVQRRFAANEYELYVSDAWRLTNNLTVTLGLRYSLFSPPWETEGNQVTPSPGIGDWFEMRRQLMLAGRPTSDAGDIRLALGGPANSRKGYYDWDYNNFSPRVAAAWTPRFSEGWLGKLFGNGKTVIRSGWSVVYDRIGSALIATFDESGSFGLSTNITSFFGGCSIGPNAFITDPACERFTGVFDTAAASAQSLVPSPGASFPSTPPSGLLTVSTSVDDNLRTPYAHLVNLTVGRELPWGMSVEAGYVGRLGRKLLLIRDYAMPADLVDATSGISAYQAARDLIGFAEQNSAVFANGFLTLPNMQYWENLFPSFGPAGNNGGCLRFGALGVTDGPDGMAGTMDDLPQCGWSATQVAFDYMIGYHGTPAAGAGFGTSTFWQDVDYFGFPGFLNCPTGTDLDGDTLLDCPNAFFPAQYVNLHTWGSVARSNYHAFQLTVRKATRHGITFTANYALSKSLDHSSTPERQEIIGGFFAGGYSGAAINSWDFEKEYGFSDFDMRHQFNSNWIIELPFGRGKRFGSDANPVLQQLIGGWTTSGILRWNSSLPAGVVNGRSWPTNWDLQGNATCTPAGAYRFGLARAACPSTQNVKDVNGRGPNIFANPDGAFTQFRFTETGERGGRNNLRADNYANLDFALIKSIDLPWEGHELKFRWDVFNFTNSAYFDAVYLNLDIETQSTFGDYTAVLGAARRMQMSLRYSF